jgi:hypothetical protein
VANAYLDGLEQAAANEIALVGISSVASFFVFRVDTEAGNRLEKRSAPPRHWPFAAWPAW